MRGPFCKLVSYDSFTLMLSKTFILEPLLEAGVNDHSLKRCADFAALFQAALLHTRTLVLFKGVGRHVAFFALSLGPSRPFSLGNVRRTELFAKVSSIGNEMCSTES